MKSGGKHGVYAPMTNMVKVNGEWENLPSAMLTSCEYRKEMKCLTLASEYFGMPSKFELVSNHTGKRVIFTTVMPGDPLFSEDHWDGEQQIYRPSEALPNVEYLVIYHQY
jgi:hypothetical protein